MELEWQVTFGQKDQEGMQTAPERGNRERHGGKNREKTGLSLETRYVQTVLKVRFTFNLVDTHGLKENKEHQIACGPE